MNNQENPSNKSSDWLRYVDSSIKYFGIIWQARWRILRITLILCIPFGIYLYFSPGSFVSTTTLLPDLQGLQNLQKRGAIGELAAAAGLTMGLTPSQLFPEIIRSERILGEIMKRKVNLRDGTEPRTLVDLWNLTTKDTSEQYESGLKNLRSIIDVTLDRRTMIVTVQVTTESAQLSAQLANAVVKELDLFTLEFRKKLAGEQREWIENRLVEVQGDLTKTEESLKQFRERNRSVLNSPQLLLEQARLARAVEINSTIFIELKKQFEIAKIEEAKSMSIIIVLDPARPPFLKSGPARRYVMATFFGIVLFLNLLYVIAMHSMRRHPEISERLTNLKSILAFRKKND